MARSCASLARRFMSWAWRLPGASRRTALALVIAQSNFFWFMHCMPSSSEAVIALAITPSSRGAAGMPASGFSTGFARTSGVFGAGCTATAGSDWVGASGLATTAGGGSTTTGVGLATGTGAVSGAGGGTTGTTETASAVDGLAVVAASTGARDFDTGRSMNHAPPAITATTTTATPMATTGKGLVEVAIGLEDSGRSGTDGARSAGFAGMTTCGATGGITGFGTDGSAGEITGGGTGAETGVATDVKSGAASGVTSGPIVAWADIECGAAGVSIAFTAGGAGVATGAVTANDVPHLGQKRASGLQALPQVPHWQVAVGAMLAGGDTETGAAADITVA